MVAENNRDSKKYCLTYISLFICNLDLTVSTEKRNYL